MKFAIETTDIENLKAAIEKADKLSFKPLPEIGKARHLLNELKVSLPAFLFSHAVCERPTYDLNRNGLYYPICTRDHIHINRVSLSPLCKAAFNDLQLARTAKNIEELTVAISKVKSLTAIESKDLQDAEHLRTNLEVDTSLVFMFRGHEI